MVHACGEPNEIELTVSVLTDCLTALFQASDHQRARRATGEEPFNFTPMVVKSISSGSPHVRPMGRT